MSTNGNGTYHHGDLHNALRQSASAILEEEGLAALSLRAVARRAGVSHAAPYRHFPSHESLLAELATDGFAELCGRIADAGVESVAPGDRIAAIGGAYMRFASQKPALTRLMFGAQLPNRAEFPALKAAADALGTEIGRVLGDDVLGMAAWGAVHGLAMLVLENVIDLGQRQSGGEVLPSRAEILLRSLFTLPPA
ncbi:MAG: TetR/AcrR family transcriptional regulator [Pseudomonadota bacterium]|nr:TetR/AcrR family transcriptional regulator [Pseudomonadota bacterium]